MEIKSYIIGFVDGEGSFLVSFNKRTKLSVGIEVRPSFAVSQHRRNLDIIKRLHKYFDCGGVRYSRRDQNYKFEVRSLSDLVNNIIPHFRQFPLQTSKKNDFELFVKVCKLMKVNQHLSVKGIKEIIDYAYKMNNIGSRRYAKKELLKIVSKVKV